MNRSDACAEVCSHALFDVLEDTGFIVFHVLSDSDVKSSQSAPNVDLLAFFAAQLIHALLGVAQVVLHRTIVHDAFGLGSIVLLEWISQREILSYTRTGKSFFLKMART